MSEFSEILSSAMRDSGLSLRLLAKKSGFDPSLLTRVRSGKSKTQNKEGLSLLFDALCLSAQKREELENAYVKDIVGEAAYASHMQVKKLAESLGRPRTLACKLPMPVLPDDVNSVEGLSNVHNLLRTVAERECGMDDAHLLILSPPQRTFLAETLALCAANHPDASITHLFTLRPRPSADDGLQKGESYNIECVRAVLPALFAGNAYNAYYTYDVDGGLTLLPNIMLSREYAVCFSSSTESAIVLRDKEHLKLLRTLFNKQLAGADMLFKRGMTLQEQMEYYTSKHLETAEKSSLYSISWQPCLLLFLRPSDAEALCADTPEIKQICTMFFTGYQGLVMRRIKNSCFTREGLENFAAHGVLNEIPYGFAQEFPVAMRRRMLQEMLDKASEGSYVPHVIKADKLALPKEASLSMDENENVSIGTVYAEHGESNYVLKERTAAAAVAQFIRFLPEHDWLYSEEESLEIVREVMEKI